jgi:hypothetical protein
MRVHPSVSREEVVMSQANNPWAAGSRRQANQDGHGAPLQGRSS